MRWDLPLVIAGLAAGGLAAAAILRRDLVVRSIRALDRHGACSADAVSVRTPVERACSAVSIGAPRPTRLA